MESEAFRTFLRGWLERTGWNIPQLARTTGIADPVIRRWLVLHAPKRPSDANLRKLAPVLQVSEDQLLRLCGYLDGDTGAITQGDPELAAVNAAWPKLPEWRRKAIQVLASAAVTAGLLPTNSGQPARAHVGVLA